MRCINNFLDCAVLSACLFSFVEGRTIKILDKQGIDALQQ